jgi:hypothetical protein
MAGGGAGKVGARAALFAGEEGRFLSIRAAALTTHLERFLRARAAWNLSGRPSIQYVLLFDEESAGSS